MYYTAHAALGILISQHVDTPLQAFGWSFASHFVLDFIPHGDEGLEDWMRSKKSRLAFVAGADVAILIATVVALFASDTLGLNRELAMAGLIGSILPDFLSHAFPDIHRKLNWFFLVRWLKRILETARISPILRFLNRRQDRLHFFIHNLPERNLTWTQGLVFQILLTGLFIILTFRT